MSPIDTENDRNPNSQRFNAFSRTSNIGMLQKVNKEKHVIQFA